jgi:hypothetical protein
VDPASEGRGGTAALVSWRYARLRRAGLDVRPAELLSHERDLDLHALIELVERGCPPDVAVRIVAPLDTEAPAC